MTYNHHNIIQSVFIAIKSFCAIQQVLIVYLFYIQQCISVNPKLIIYPSSPFPFGNHKFVFYVCVSIYVLYISSFVSLDSTYKGYHMIFVFLCLAYFSQYDNLRPSIHFTSQAFLLHAPLSLKIEPFYQHAHTHTRAHTHTHIHSTFCECG